MFGWVWLACGEPKTGPAAGPSGETGGETTPTPPGERFHEPGWAEPAAHGIGAKFQQLDCRSCHGETLDGGTAGVSCDSCHPAGWRSDCTFCHGGVETPDGAPPENLDDSVGAADLANFPAHTAHVTETIHPAWACDLCHVTPTDVSSAGHLFVGDTTPGVAEVAYPGGTYTGAGSCASVYCHGDGRSTATVDASFVSSCDACHPSWASSDAEIGGMSGEHHRHVAGEGFDCSECHSTTVDASHTIVGAANHVDGEPTVSLPQGMTWNGSSCSGTCHFQLHFLNGW